MAEEQRQPEQVLTSSKDNDDWGNPKITSDIEEALDRDLALDSMDDLLDSAMDAEKTAEKTQSAVEEDKNTQKPGLRDRVVELLQKLVHPGIEKREDVPENEAKQADQTAMPDAKLGLSDAEISQPASLMAQATIESMPVESVEHPEMVDISVSQKRVAAPAKDSAMSLTEQEQQAKMGALDILLDKKEDAMRAAANNEDRSDPNIDSPLAEAGPIVSFAKIISDSRGEGSSVKNNLENKVQQNADRGPSR